MMEFPDPELDEEEFYESIESKLNEEELDELRSKYDDWGSDE